jgi:hypothetical protein
MADVVSEMLAGMPEPLVKRHLSTRTDCVRHRHGVGASAL